MKVEGSKCLPARPSKTGKAITFGIQAKFSNLLKFFFLKKFETSFDYEGILNMYQCMNLYPQRVT